MNNKIQIFFSKMLSLLTLMVVQPQMSFEQQPFDILRRKVEHMFKSPMILIPSTSSLTLNYSLVCIQLCFHMEWEDSKTTKGLYPTLVKNKSKTFLTPNNHNFNNTIH